MDARESTEKNTDELLREILKYQKRSSRMTRIAAIAVIFIVAVFAVAVGLIIPRAVNLVDHVSNSLAEVDAMIDHAGGMMENINKVTEEFNDLIADASILIDNSNSMVEDNTDAITETVNKLNSMDFDTLNKAIKDLSNVVEPLAKFFNVFKK